MSDDVADMGGIEFFALGYSILLGLIIFVSPPSLLFNCATWLASILVCSLYGFISLVKWLNDKKVDQSLTIMLLWTLNLGLQTFSLFYASRF